MPKGISIGEVLRIRNTAFDNGKGNAMRVQVCIAATDSGLLAMAQLKSNFGNICKKSGF
jgi:hypothetical protein